MLLYRDLLRVVALDDIQLALLAPKAHDHDRDEQIHQDVVAHKEQQVEVNRDHAPAGAREA